MLKGGFPTQSLLNLTGEAGCLTHIYLSDLMTVLLETPDVDQFDSSSAVKHWNHAEPRARRPNIITDIGDIDDDTAWGHCGGLESRVMRPLTTSRTSGSDLVLIE